MSWAHLITPLILCFFLCRMEPLLFGWRPLLLGQVRERRVKEKGRPTRPQGDPQWGARQAGVCVASQSPTSLPIPLASSCLPWSLVLNKHLAPQTPSQLCLQTSQPGPLFLTHRCHPRHFIVSCSAHCFGLSSRLHHFLFVLSTTLQGHPTSLLRCPHKM